jgi:hypothetical protein
LNTEAGGETGVVVKSEDQRARCIIKISRRVRMYIEEKATLHEPTDRTLRRLLGLKLQDGEYGPKPPPPKNQKKPAEWTTIKVTEIVRAHIIKQAQWNESVDHTIRRLLKIPFED